MKKFDVYGNAVMHVGISVEADNEHEALYEAAQRRACEWKLTSAEVQPKVLIESATESLVRP